MNMNMNINMNMNMNMNKSKCPSIVCSRCNRVYPLKLHRCLLSSVNQVSVKIIILKGLSIDLNRILYSSILPSFIILCALLWTVFNELALEFISELNVSIEYSLKLFIESL